MSKQLHIVSFSGGKDSTAMLLRMIELNMRIDKIIFADTKLEFPETYEYIKKVEKHIGREITILRTEREFDDIFYGTYTRGKYKGIRRGFPWMLYPCWWATESKHKMLDAICNGNIRYIGIAADEPKRIGNKEGFTYPLNDWGWTEKDCLEYLKDKNLHNPLYDRFKRLGCWLCPKQGVASLKSLYKYYPELWIKLKKYEADSPQGINPDIKLVELEKRFKREIELTERQQKLF